MAAQNVGLYVSHRPHCQKIRSGWFPALVSHKPYFINERFFLWNEAKEWVWLYEQTFLSKNKIGDLRVLIRGRIQDFCFSHSAKKKAGVLKGTDINECAKCGANTDKNQDEVNINVFYLSINHVCFCRESLLKPNFEQAQMEVCLYIFIWCYLSYSSSSSLIIVVNCQCDSVQLLPFALQGLHTCILKNTVWPYLD